MTATYLSNAQLPNQYGNFTIHVFTDENGVEHPALTMGKLEETPLARIHSICTTGDVFGSKRCDCQSQLHVAMRMIAESGNGILIYLRHQEGRGIGLGNKIRAYALQEQGFDTVRANVALGYAADMRNYDIAAEILRHFGIGKIRLMTNNPAKIEAMQTNRIEVVERVSLWTAQNPHNAPYIDAKKQKMKHMEG
ncbi:MAG: GTP cyclohydrolase II [Alphaproteobacteria bacterium]